MRIKRYFNNKRIDYLRWQDYNIRKITTPYHLWRLVNTPCDFCNVKFRKSKFQEMMNVQCGIVFKGRKYTVCPRCYEWFYYKQNKRND